MEQYIWLIDDDAAIRDSLSLLLSTVGWQTQAFDSAHAFQHQAGNLAELTGCMLLDIRMPGKTGLTLLDEWRQLGLTAAGYYYDRAPILIYVVAPSKMARIQQTH